MTATRPPAVIVRYDGDRVLANRTAIAEFYAVSDRTVRRHCHPVRYDATTKAALYDVLAAGQTLADVAGRPHRTRAALRLPRCS